MWGHAKRGLGDSTVCGMRRPPWSTLGLRSRGAVAALAVLTGAVGPGPELSDAQAACVNPPPGIVSWWRAEGNGSDGFGANGGTLVNGLGFAAGEVGQTLNFVSAGQEVAIPASASLNVGTSAGLSIEAWINPSDVAAQHPLAEWNDGVNFGAHFWFSVAFSGLGGPGCLFANLRDTGFNSHYFFSPVGLVQAGAWQHVALTYDQASGVATLFLNGLPTASTNLGVFTPLTGYPLHLGQRPNAETYLGLLDEVSLYSRALSGAEIQAIYLAGAGGKCPVAPMTGTTLISEGFEGVFPGSWSTGDGDPNGTTAYWRDVNSTFGGEGAHTGNWKGYCAGTSYPFGSTEPNPTYQNYMQAYMEQFFNRLGYGAISLSFWYKIPSIELCCDRARVYFNGTVTGSHLLWESGTPTTAWTPATIDLTPYDVFGTLRFEFDSDLSVVNEGWYLDDISVMAYSAGAGETIQSLAVLNNVVLEADSLSAAAGRDREFVTAESVVRSSNPTANPSNYTCTLTYRLLDASGTPFPIHDSTGVLNGDSTYNVTNAVTLPPFSQMDQDARAALRPAATLNPTNLYTLELRLFKNGVFTGVRATNGPLAFFHFTNVVSGDPLLNVLGRMNSITLTRAWAISNSLSQGAFPVKVSAVVARYDDFNLPPSSAVVPFVFNYQLLNTGTGLPVPLRSSQTTVNVTLPSHTGGALPGAVVQSMSTTLLIDPLVQLDPVDTTYQVVVSLSHSENSTVFDHGTRSIAPTRLFHFNSRLLFGSFLTYFTNLNSVPTVTNVFAGDHLDLGLPISPEAGVIAGAPGHTFGDGTALPVALFKNGDAVIRGNVTVNIHGPAPDIDCVQNICFERSSLLLGTNGARGFISLILPAGFSVGISPTNRLTVGRLEYANTPLNDQLRPQSTALVTTGPLYGVEETFPFWIAAPSLTWQITGGALVLNSTGVRFVRQEEDDLLTTVKPGLADPDSANRVSNDGYYRNVGLAGGSSVTVVADANGVARISTQLTMAPPELRPHFPYAGFADGNQIPTAPGGSLVIDDGLIASSSFLPVSGPVPLSYARDCAETNCPVPQVGSVQMSFTTAAGQLQFTRDGGLLAYGSVPRQNLTWGYISGSDYAQRTSDVETGAYHMPGTFLRWDQTTLEDAQRPAVLLFSGFGDASDPSYFERPSQPGYLDGFANYAGLNFRSPAEGRSFIADQLSPWYPLTARSKYYTRWGGVSGIHESATFPSTLTLYGYNFTFLSYRVSYLDSENWESRTDGAIAFPPQPAGFTQEFERMTFLCRGALDSAQVPASSGVKHLNYWTVNFLPQSIQFQPADSAPCSLANRFLVLGVETKLPFIPQAFHAALGFKANGNLLTAANPAGQVDSRFAVPGQLSLQGPGDSFFPLATASDGYFNNWETPGRPDAGFFNLVGRIRVPFFEDVKVQLHVTPTGSNSAQIAIVGGWRAADGSGEDRGWNDGMKNYYNTAKFDKPHDGWPLGVSLANYRASPTVDFRPRAQRDWIEVAKFDYPLEWNTSLHKFAGFQDAKVILPVIDVNSRLKELSPGKIDFDFAQDISLQLPRLKVLDFANDAINELNGPLNTVSNALRQELGLALNASGLAGGFRGLQRLLRENAEDFFRPVLQATLDPAVDTMYPILAAAYAADPVNFLNNVNRLVTNSSSGLRAALTQLNGAAGQANTVMGQLNQTLIDVTNTLNLFLRVLEKDGGGRRHVVRALIQKLVQDQGPELGFAVNLADQNVNDLLAELEPTLAEIESELRDLLTQARQLQSQIALATGDFADALAMAQSTGAPVQDYLGKAGASVSSLYAMVLTPAGDYFTADPAAAKRELRERLLQAFLASTMSAGYQQTFRQFLFDDNFLLDQLMDALFDQINRSVRDGLSTFLSGAQDGMFQNMKGGGFLSGSLFSAKIRGAPTFDGDSLRRIHLDASIKMDLPDEMTFTAFMDIKELDSKSTPLSCIPQGAPAAEVTLGARDVPLNWAGLASTSGRPLTLTVEARWTLQSGAVLGVGGLFDIKGEVGFKGCSVKEIGATLAVGQIESYFAAKAAGSVLILGIPVDLHAGLFAGHACSLDPLKFIDPEVGQVLNNPETFSGIYVEYGGGVSLSEILFGTSTCLLDIEATQTTAIYYQGGPRGALGGRQKMAVDVSLLCLISGHVDWAVLMRLTGSDLTLGASANVCGSIGPCPFCIEGCKGITVTGVLNDGGIDYSIDY